MDRVAVRDEMARAQQHFHRTLDLATPAELRRPSDGTRWTNEQLLFHMLFGYLIVRTLLRLVQVVDRLPDRWSRAFARGLDASTPAFHLINYAGSVVGPRVLGHAGMHRALDLVMASLLRSLSSDSERTLARGMPFPQRWDPYFPEQMTVQDLYSYGSVHYAHHRRQLTLDGAEGLASRAGGATHPRPGRP